MTDPPPAYHAPPAPGHDAAAMPRRAVNLARRMLDIERQCGGRGRVAYEVIMIDGEWLLITSKPGPVERLGE